MTVGGQVETGVVAVAVGVMLPVGVVVAVAVGVMLPVGVLVAVEVGVWVAVAVILPVGVAVEVEVGEEVKVDVMETARFRKITMVCETAVPSTIRTLAVPALRSLLISRSAGIV